MAKKFFYVSLGILALAAAHQLGAARTEAQSGGTFSGISLDGNSGGTVAITTTGDVYARSAIPTCNGAWVSPQGCDTGWHHMGNVLDPPISVEGGTWGSIKSNFK